MLIVLKKNKEEENKICMRFSEPQMPMIKWIQLH